MAPHSGTLAWKIPLTAEPGRLQSMGSLRVGHDWATSLSLFTFTHWRRKWQPSSSSRVTWKQTLRWGLQVGSFTGENSQKAAYKALREAGRGRDRAWKVMRLQWRPQPILTGSLAGSFRVVTSRAANPQLSLAICSYKNEVTSRCGCWPSTYPQRSSGWKSRMSHLVLQEKLAERVFM